MSARKAAATEAVQDPLLKAVREVLDSAGMLGVQRVLRHPGRVRAVAVRGELLDCYAPLLEGAGFAVERCGGVLVVSEQDYAPSLVSGR